MRAEFIGHCKPCTTDIYLHIVARMEDYIYPHAPVIPRQVLPFDREDNGGELFQRSPAAATSRPPQHRRPARNMRPAAHDLPGPRAVRRYSFQTARTDAHKNVGKFRSCMVLLRR